MDVWKASPGLSVPYQATFCDSNGNPITFAGTEALTGTVWAGGSLAALFTLTPTWATPASGVVNVIIPGASTANLAIGTYRVILTVVVNGVPCDGFECALQITYAPGSVASRPTYITVEDLRGVAKWIDTLQNLDTGQEGFADVLADSRDWLDQMCLRNYRGGDMTLLGMHGVALNAWFTGGPRRTGLDNVWLAQQLAANKLLVTAPLKKAMAYYAASQICESMVGAGAEWAKRQAYYQQKAFTKLVGTVAQLDLNGDGIPEVPINFSSASTLFS